MCWLKSRLNQILKRERGFVIFISGQAEQMEDKKLSQKSHNNERDNRQNALFDELIGG